MRDSVPSTRYSSVCNVLRQWNIPLIPTYRVGRLYDITLYFIVMHCIILYYSAQYNIVLYYTVLHNTVVYCINCTLL